MVLENSRHVSRKTLGSRAGRKRSPLNWCSPPFRTPAPKLLPAVDKQRLDIKCPRQKALCAVRRDIILLQLTFPEVIDSLAVVAYPQAALSIFAHRLNRQAFRLLENFKDAPFTRFNPPPLVPTQRHPSWSTRSAKTDLLDSSSAIWS